MSRCCFQLESLEPRVLLSAGTEAAPAPVSDPAHEMVIVEESPAPQTEALDRGSISDVSTSEWLEAAVPLEMTDRPGEPERRRAGLQAVTLVPDRVDPAAATPLLLAPGSLALSLPASGRGVVGLWSFALDASMPFDAVTFRMTSSLNAPTDFALALYDADGNRIQVADEHGSGPGSLESLSLAELRTGRSYCLAVVSQLTVPASSYSLIAELPSPELLPAVSLNPATGSASYSASTLGTLLRSAADLHFHPLILLNAGEQVTIKVQPNASDTDLQVAIFRRNAASQVAALALLPRYELEPATAVATASGQPLEVRLVAQPGSSLSEGTYVLAVAPKGFASRPTGYRIDVTAELPLLVPSRPDRTVLDAGTLLVQRPTSELGTAEALLPEESLADARERFYRFRPPADGQAQISVTAGFGTVVALYSAAGPTLLEVATHDGSGTSTIVHTLEGGDQYYIRVAPGAGRSIGLRNDFAIELRTPYSWRDLVLRTPTEGATSTGYGTVFIGGGAAPVFYQVLPDEQLDFITLSVPSGATQEVRISVQGVGFTEELVAPRGQTATLPIRTLGRPGPLYVSLSSEVGSLYSSLLYAGQLVIPRELPFEALTGRQANVATGDVNAPATPVGGFGSRTGFSYYHFLTQPNQTSRWTATGQNGVIPLLVRYVENGSSLRMVDYELASASNTATMERRLPSERLYAAAAFNVSLVRDGGTIALKADNPTPVAVGVGMTPDLEFENRPEYQFGSIPVVGPVASQYTFQVEPKRYGSILRIEPITLEHDFDQDLWETILPENFFPGSATENPAWPVLRLAPESPNSDLQLRLTLFDGEGQLLRRFGQTFISPFTSSPGQALFINFADLGVFRQSLIGAKLRFRVEAISGQLGDGVYSLRMTVRTTNPHPYEVTETAWKFAGTNPARFAPGDNLQVGTLPAGTDVTDVVQNQLGDGTADGEFVSSTVGVHVYRFWTPASGPLRVWTSPLSSDPANTSIKLYRARFIVESDAERSSWWNDVEYLGQLRAGSTEISGNTDWYPADRSTIDAQIVISDPLIALYSDSFAGDPIVPGSTPVNESQLKVPFQPRDRQLTGGGYYFYVVVKNEQGSQGKYRLHVDTGDLPLIDDVPVRMPLRPSAANNGSVLSMSIPDVTAYRNRLGYLPIQMPERHSGYLEVRGELGATWEFQLFDRTGDRVPLTLVQTVAPPSSARFDVPSGPQIVYLRVREGTAAESTASLRLQTTLTEDAGLPSTFSTLNADALAQRVLPSDPFGNVEEFSDSVSVDAIGKVYRISAPPGRLTVSVELGSNVSAVWGLYAHGRLFAWDKAVPGDAASQTTELWLPSTMLPGADQSFFLSDPRHPLLLFVKHASISAQAAQYKISVDTHHKPLVIGINSGNTSAPLPPAAFEAGTTRFDSAEHALEGGDRWLRIVAPDGSKGGLTLLDLPTSSALYPLRYDLYDASGLDLITSGVRTERGTGSLSLPQVVGGAAYLLRVTGRDRAANFPLHFSYQLNKEAKNGENFIYSVPPARASYTGAFDARPAPNVDGDFSLVQSFSGRASLWVVHHIGNAGPARFTATFKGSDNVRIAVYHIRGLTAEFPQMTLVDYLNEADMASSADGKVLTLDTFLQEGVYFIELRRSNTTGGEVRLDGLTPEYDVENLVIDPNQGISQREQLGIVRGNQFETHFFRVRAPAGSMGEASFEAIDVRHRDGGPAKDLQRKAIFSVTEVKAGIGQVGGLSPGLSTQLDLTRTQPEKATLTTRGDAAPFTEYLIAVHGTGSQSAADDLGRLGVGALFQVPISGTPDLVVESIVLKPNNGQTLVEVSVRNRGYATAFTSQARFVYPSGDPAEPIVAELSEGTIGPQTRRIHLLDWIDPVSPDDVTSYTVDAASQIEEVDEANNAASVALKTVDAHRPTLTLSLAHGQDGNADPGVWGRYVDSRTAASAKVRDDIVIKAQDVDDAADTYDTGAEIFLIRTDSPIAYTTGSWIAKSEIILEDKALSHLAPTTANNPNLFSAFVKDRFGLRSDSVTRRIEVVPFPSWLDTSGSELTYESGSKTYHLQFRAQAVEYQKTLSQMLGVNVPFVGDWRNEFIVEAAANGTASLDPDAPAPTLVPEVHVNLTVLDQEIFDRTFRTGVDVGSNVTVQGLLVVDGHTLEATQLQLGFALNNLFLGSFESPEIPIFGFDAAVVSAAVQAQVIGRASASAAVTLAFDLTEGGAPIALVSPTFVGLDLSLELRFEGELEVLGWDIASVGGGFIFTLKPKFGLEHTTAPVALDDFFDEACFELSATLGGELSADVLGVEVYSVEFESPPINFTDCDVATQSAPVSDGSRVTHRVALAAPPAIQLQQRRPGGAEPVGAVASRPTPQLIIHPSTGEQLFTYLDYQIVNGQPTVPTLSFARGNDSAFSAPIVLPSGEFVVRPMLAATNDGPGFRAVLVYQSTPLPDASTSRNSFFAGQDLKYRYFDGSSWSDEIALTDDALMDSQATLAFNAAGKGVVAWVKNTNAAPIAANGVFQASGNEVYGALWNPTTHRFGTVSRLSTQTSNDTQPTGFVAADGTYYVAWINRPGNETYLARSTGGAWAATRVRTTSLPEGRPLGLVLSGDASGKLTVFTAFRVQPIPHTPTRTYVVTRAGTYAELSAIGPVEIVAQTGGISNFRGVTAPDGSLVLSWHERRGSFSDVVALRRPLNSAASPWAPPVRLTQNDGAERAPSVAVAPDGSFRVVFERGARFFAADDGRPIPQDGPSLATPAGTANLLSSTRVAIGPELSFTRPITLREYAPESDGRPSLPSAVSPVPTLVTSAVAAGTTVATTEIVNTGNQAADVTIDFLLANVLSPVRSIGQQKVRLAPGAIHQIEFTFQPPAGSSELSIRLTSSVPEVFSARNNVASATVRALADLAVENLSVAAGAFGTEAALTFRLANRGAATYSGPVELITFWSDPSKPSERIVAQTVTQQVSIAAGASIGLLNRLRLDRVGLRVVGVEARFTVAELTLANNVALGSVDTRPDLALVPAAVNTRLSTDPVTVTVLNASGTNNAVVQVLVTNRGDAPVTGFQLKILHALGDGPFKEVASQAVTATIAPGATAKPVEVPVSALAGTNRYRAVVELLRADLPKAGERDRANNAAETAVVVRGLADMVVGTVRSSIAGSPPQVRVGQALRLDVEVRNAGIADAKNVLVEVFATGPRGVNAIFVGRAVVPSVAALGSATVAIALDTGKLDLDTTSLHVVLDRQGRLVERNNANNDRSLVITVLPPVLQNTGYFFNSGATQLSTVRSLTFTFNRDLRTSAGAGSLVLTRLDTGDVITSQQLAVQVNATARQVTWTFPGLTGGTLAPGEYEARLKARSVTDTNGNVLTKDVVVRFTITPGDATGDGRTNDRDYLLVWQQLRLAEGVRSLNADVTGDGKVDAADLEYVKKNYGRTGAQTLTAVPISP